MMKVSSEPQIILSEEEKKEEPIEID